jgi:hypothetical protein
MVEGEGGAGGGEVAAAEVIALPLGGIVYLQLQMAEDSPLPGEDAGHVLAERFAQGGRGEGARGQKGEALRAGRWDGSVGERPMRVGHLGQLATSAQEHLHRAHGPQPVPVPSQPGHGEGRAAVFIRPTVKKAQGKCQATRTGSVGPLW